MKKKVTALLGVSIAALFLFTGCSGTEKSGSGEVTVVNVADRQDIPEIWEAVNKILEPENIRVVNKAYDSSVNLNDLLVSGDIDMNVAQHYAYLEICKESSDKYADLVALGDISTESLDLYSNKYDSLDELPDGALIGIPSDITNGARAFVILQTAGLIELNDDYDIFPEERNITSNPKKLTFTPVDTTSMLRSLDDVDAGFIYSTTAVYGGLDIVNDPIYRDVIDLENNEFQRQFTLIFTGVKGDESNEVYKKVIDAYHSEDVFKAYKEHSC